MKKLLIILLLLTAIPASALTVFKSNQLLDPVGEGVVWSTGVGTSTLYTVATSSLGITASVATSTLDTWLTTKTTDDLTEGLTNLYWTLTRFQTALKGGYDAVFGTATSTLLVANSASTTALKTNYIDLNPGLTAPVYTQGRMFFDSDNHTASVMLNSEVTGQFFEENLIYVRNNSGVDINNSQVVYSTGAVGGHPTVALAQANSTTTARVLGMATENILNNEWGYVTTFGEVRGINTASTTEQASIYLSATTPGAYTEVPPTGTNYTVRIGRVLVSNPATGSIFMNMGIDYTNGSLFNNLRANNLEVFGHSTTSSLSIGTLDGVPFMASGTVSAVPNNPVGTLKFLSMVGGANPTWQTVPSGGFFVYNFYDSTASTTYKLMDTPEPGAAIKSISATYTAASTTVTQWASTSTKPNLTTIPAGGWLIHIDATKTAGVKTARVYFDVYKVGLNNVETKLFTTQESDPITETNTATPQEIDIEYGAPDITLLSTDRIAVRVYVVVTGSGTNPVVQLYWENQTQSRIELPSNTVDVTNFVPYTGAVRGLDLGNYNLLAKGASTTNATTSNLTLNGLNSTFLAANTLGQVIATTTPANYWTLNATKLYNNSGSEVGIGTTTPTATLQIQGTSTTPLLNVTSSSSATSIYVSNMGNVGLGTITPGSILETKGISPFIIQRDQATAVASNLYLLGGTQYVSSDTSTNAGGNYASIESYIIDTNSSLQGGTEEGGALWFNVYRQFAGTTGLVKNTALMIDNLSRIGIGTTSPTATLYVQGSSTIPLMNITMPSTVSAFYVSNAGNTGIGTTTPSNKLEVNGNGYLNGNLTAANITATGTLTATGKTTMTTASTTHFTASGNVDLSSTTLKIHKYPAFTFPAGPAVATTTTGTSTVAIGPAYTPQLFNALSCWSGSTTVAFQLSDGTNKSNLLSASTTVGRANITTNNTFTADEKRYIEIGPMTANYLSCSFDVTEN